jgi:plasmid stabilization system protein ParE
MLKWTPKSEDDLDEIRDHIAKNFNVELAIQTVNEIIDYVEGLLARNSLAGAILESNPFFSKLVYQGNSIFYCENPKDRDLYIVYVRPRGTTFKANRLNDKEIA